MNNSPKEVMIKVNGVNYFRGIALFNYHLAKKSKNSKTSHFITATSL